MSNTASLNKRDILFTIELYQAMQGFALKEKHREASFGKLFREYLKGSLSSSVNLRHQMTGKNIVDIRLQAYVRFLAAQKW